MSDYENQTSTPDFVYALAASSSQVCFAARQTGLFFTVNGGQSWASAYGSLSLDEPLSTACLAILPGSDRRASLLAGVLGYVMLSENGGKDWTASPLPLNSSIPTAIIPSPSFSTDGFIFAATNEDGVLRSPDGGRSWSSWNFSLVDFNVLCLAVSPDFAKDETVYAGTGSGLFRSQNGGKSWQELNLPAGFVPVLSLAISAGFERDGTLLAGTEADGLYLSEDRGQTWKRLNENGIDGVLNQIVLHPEFPSNGEVLVTHDNSVLRSTDRGGTWSVLLEAEITALAAIWDPAGKLILWVGLADGSVKRI